MMDRWMVGRTGDMAGPRGSEEFHPGGGTQRSELARDGARMGRNYGKDARQEGNQVKSQNMLITYARSMFWGVHEKIWPEGVTRATEGRGGAALLQGTSLVAPKPLPHLICLLKSNPAIFLEVLPGQSICPSVPDSQSQSL